jgi:hypothetical protein
VAGTVAVGLFSYLFSPSQLYTTPVFIFVQTAPSSAIGSRPIFREQVARSSPGLCFADAIKHPEIRRHITTHQTGTMEG